MKQYLDLLRRIKDTGTVKTDRTGTGTVSIFAPQMRFNLSDGFPLVTTKKTHLKSIIYELLWFLKGDTNIKYLNDNGVKIWDEWADKNGNLGPIYGKQWVGLTRDRWVESELSIASGGTQGGSTRYSDPVNQIQDMVDLLKNTPDSRRMVVSAWNVVDLPQMRLSPCHCLFQFYTAPLSFAERKAYYFANIWQGSGQDVPVDEIYLDKIDVPSFRLDCQLYQRSADFFLGVPFNIASYALLTMMMAQVVNMVPGEFIWTGGDTHLYLNHFEQADKQLAREPKELPTMKLNPKITDIFNFSYEDFTLDNYNPYPGIKAPVAV